MTLARLRDRLRNEPILPYIVAAAFFMENLDGTIVTTVLPQIAASFQVAPEDLALGVTAYLVTLAAFIPSSGWAAERFGSRRVFVGAIGLFTLSSIACGLSTSLPMFLAARVVQGFAAAWMSPVGRLVVLRTTERKDLVRAIATLTWPALIGPVVGPPLGGAIATAASWHWIFFINVPLGLLGAIAAYRFTPEQKAHEPPPFDLAGFLLTAAALAGLVVGLDLIGRVGANLAVGAGLIAASLVFGALALRHARRAPRPMLDLRPVAAPLFRISIVTWGFVARIAISGMPFLLPLLFQLTFGFDPLQAGTMVLIYMAGNLGMKTITTPMLRWFGFRRLLVIANLVTAACMAACGFFRPELSSLLIYGLLFVAGASRSMTFTAVNTMAFADVAPDDRPAATALSTLSTQLGVTLGVALAALALNLALGFMPAPQLSLEHFRAAFLLMAVMSLGAALGFARIAPDAGQEVSGHGRPRIRA